MDRSAAAYKESRRPSLFCYISLPSRSEGREGKRKILGVPLCRLGLNDPPTAVGGIAGLFAQSLQLVDRSSPAYSATPASGSPNYTNFSWWDSLPAPSFLFEIKLTELAVSVGQTIDPDCDPLRIPFIHQRVVAEPGVGTR